MSLRTAGLSVRMGVSDHFVNTNVVFHGHLDWGFEGSGVPRGLGVPPRNSEDIGGVLDRMSKKNRRLDFLLQFTVFSYGCNLLNKGYF